MGPPNVHDFSEVRFSWCAEFVQQSRLPVVVALNVDSVMIHRTGFVAYFFFKKAALTSEPWMSKWQSIQSCPFPVESCAWTRDSPVEESCGG
jgi:hypothetical protein